MSLALELPSPVECGLPEKFTEWRPQQLVSIQRGIDSESRFILQGSPTGTGKTANGMAQAILQGKRPCYLTATKGLQDQIKTEWESVGAADIRGKNAYRCNSNPDAYSCEEGQILHCRHIASGTCPHLQAQRKAAVAPIVVTNYTCYVTNHLGFHPEGPVWGDFDMLICDEAHDCDTAVGNCIAMEYDSREILDILGTKFPDPTPMDWWEFAKVQIGPLRRQVASYEALYKNRAPEGYEAKRYIISKRLLTKLERTAALCGQHDWLIEGTKYGFKLEPLWSAPYMEKYLFRGVPNVLLMSATLTRKTAGLVGIAPDDMDFQEYPSPFDPRRSPVYLIPTVKVDYRMSQDQERLWASRIDAIISARLDRKGIIHSVSFQRAQQILRNSEHGRIMIVPESGGTAEAVERFKRAKPPKVLVSPSVDTGYDFPGSDCRYQIIAKIPFPDTRSEIVKARCAADGDYQSYLAMQRLVQACGRGMRGADDWQEVMIVDDNSRWFIGKNQHLMPQYFKRLIKRVDMLPKAMNL